MKEFDVIVDCFSVGIWKATDKINGKHHFKAVVDGEDYLYRIVNNLKDARMRKSAFGRVSVEVHYHAKNAGNYVRFEPVSNRKQSKKKKISDKQQSLF